MFNEWSAMLLCLKSDVRIKNKNSFLNLNVKKFALAEPLCVLSLTVLILAANDGKISPSPSKISGNFSLCYSLFLEKQHRSELSKLSGSI